MHLLGYYPFCMALCKEEWAAHTGPRWMLSFTIPLTLVEQGNYYFTAFLERRQGRHGN
jgi:hypothetical protein